MTDRITSNLRVEDVVDMIGALKAQIAPLAEKLKQYETELKEHGAGKYAGIDYDATVFVQSREKLNMDAVREKLSPQFLRAHTEDYAVTVLKVSAKRVRLAA